MLKINRRETPDGDAAAGDAAEENTAEEDPDAAEGDAVAGAPLPDKVAWSKSASTLRSAGLRRRPVRR
jgi:hypothetical protein